ncbi:carbohydrate binding family 9 domain-containing protein [Paraglaciecola sp. L3A3]|uniref:carbohydrate binding family 9 domain-containing protein n=1 Tax=Paraglaciecola sp. L3A3 TaxID=2686358 RepID=UPI00131ADFE8|nr:carbohydrate binding family 9 domain-containing protein [Paraglaciecola sp. L3A3]
MSLQKIYLYLLINCIYSPSLFAQFSQPIPVPNLQQGITIDGNLNESQWQQAQSFQLNVVTSPFENTTPPVQTEVKIFEDNDTLYLAFDAKDVDISKLHAFYVDRDQIWDHDLVGIKLDPFNDNRIAYQFFVNPFGIQADAIENEMTGDESDNWDAIWQSAGQVLTDSYQVEMAIPLRVLNFPESKKEKTWGAEFIRYYPRKDSLEISNRKIDRNNSCNLCQLGDISGFKNAKQGQNLAIVPTLVLGTARNRDPQNNLDWQSTNNQEIGLDVKWGITPEISFQGTINPDFSQVESDVAQLSINNTFALYFDEKRPFFLENSDYFSGYEDLVYSRNVNAPDYGLKMTGRIDKQTFGLFIANDANTSIIVPGNISSQVANIAEESINLAARYRYDISNNLSIGFTSTLRDSDNYHNYVNALDAKYQITEQDVLRIQLLNSDTLYPTDLYKDFCYNNCQTNTDYSETALRLQKNHNFSDNAYRLTYTHEQRNWFSNVTVESTGADFRTDLGFGSFADNNKIIVGGGYDWFSENSWWNRIRIDGDWDISHNDNNELLEKEAELYLSVHGQNQSYWEFGLLHRDSVGLRDDPSVLSIRDNTTLFTEDVVSIFFETRLISSFYANFYSSYGDQIDFDNNRLGTQFQFNPQVTWDIGKHLQLNLRHTYKKLDIEQDNLFVANLTDLRVTYQFDQKQFLRIILVFSDINRNQDLYLYHSVDNKQKYLGSQLLYSYKLNPLTKFFIGYSDSAEQNELVSSLTSHEQSIFMKFSYAWLN